MNDFAFGLSLCFVLVMVVLAIRQRHESHRNLEKLFEALVFETPEGPQPGSAMRVVKTVIDRSGASEGGDGVNVAFWYCAGPGPSYYVAIAQPASPFSLRKRYKWVVRPLSAERMRGALMGDAEALRAAFGDAADGKLYA